VKALTLKTAVAALILADKKGEGQPDLKFINEIRTESLGVSPIKSLSPSSGLGRVMKIINWKTR
jgi:hypothetical protein